MRCSVNSVLSLAFLTATVAAHDYYTTVEPCLACPSSVRPHPITVTKQLQPVSTCQPTTACKTKTEGYKASSTCSVIYPYHEYLWVSSVLPLPWGKGSCTVTKTDQHVTVKEYKTSVTHYTTITPTPVADTHYSNKTITKHAAPYTKVSSVDVIVIDYVCPFKRLGPHAIPGYAGSGLCTECEPKADGKAYQVVDVHKCINDKCVEYVETWEWSPPKATTSVNVRPCETSQAATTPGSYTITLVPETCKTTTVHGPTTITYPETTIVCPTAGVYTATVTPEVRTTTYISPAHGHPTTVYIHTTITKTYSYSTTECNTHKPTYTHSYTHSYTHKPTYKPTTTKHHSHTKTYSTPDPSSDPDYENGSYYKARDAAKEVKARALEYRELPKNVVRRGGVLRGKRFAEEEKAAPAHKKRDFGIPKRGLL